MTDKYTKYARFCDTPEARFVIVDDSKRGKGYGKQMLQLAILKAKQDFGAQKITLGVFDNNPSVLHCYESVGFVVTGTDTYAIEVKNGAEKKWN